MLLESRVTSNIDPGFENRIECPVIIATGTIETAISEIGFGALKMEGGVLDDPLDSGGREGGVRSLITCNPLTWHLGGLLGDQGGID